MHANARYKKKNSTGRLRYGLGNIAIARSGYGQSKRAKREKEAIYE